MIKIAPYDGMLQVVYSAVNIILSDEYVVLISNKMLLFRFKFPKTTKDAQVSFCIFPNLKGLGLRTLTKFFECCLIPISWLLSPHYNGGT